MRRKPADRRPSRGLLPVRVAVLAVVVWGSFGTTSSAIEPQSASASRFQKVLFLGNSITLHGPSAKVAWTGNWGMAASAADKDYVHLVTRGLTPASGPAPATLVKNIATFERQYAHFNVKDNLKDALDFQADLFILAIGENVPTLAAEKDRTQFAASVGELLKTLRADRQPTIVVRSCFWPNPAKDNALHEACAEVKGTFVDISSLSKDPSTYARSEREFPHAGVANHPGDRGMQAIAQAILKALQP